MKENLDLITIRTLNIILVLCQKPMLNDPPPHRWFSGKNK